MELPNGLLAAVKNHFDITWEDPEADKKLTVIVENGVNRINSSAGAIFDYSKAGRARELLFEYLMYSRAGALAEWENAYLSEILFLAHSQQIEEAKQNAEK